MAYKFQIGPAQLSGALTQEGTILVHDKAGNVEVRATEAGVLSASSDLSAGGNLDIAGNADIEGTADIADTLTLSKASGDGLVVTATAKFNGNVQLGNASGDLIQPLGRFASDVIPQNQTKDLGSSALNWKELHVLTASVGIVDASFLSGTLEHALSAAAGAGITAFTYNNSTAGVTVAVSGAAQLTNAHIVQWDDTNGKFVDSKLTETGGNVQLDSGANFEAANGDIKALSGDLSASANLDIGGAADIAGGLDAAGVVGLAAAGVATSVRGTLAVTQAATFSDSVSIAGNTTLGDAATDTVQFKADVSSSLLPSHDSAFDIGADTFRWKEIYGDTIVASQLSGGLKFNIQDGAGIADFTFDNTANVTVAVSGAAQLSDDRIVQWDNDNDKFVDSLLKQDGSDLDLTSGGFFVNAGQISASANVSAGGGLFSNGLQVHMNGAAITGNVDLANELAVVGAASFKGTVALGDAAADAISFNGELATDIIPDAASTHDLGSTARPFQAVYADNFIGNIAFDTFTHNIAGVISGSTDLALANFGSALTLQLPAGSDGKVVRIKSINTGAVTLSASVAGESLDDEINGDLVVLETKGAAVTCIFSGSSGAGKWYII